MTYYYYHEKKIYYEETGEGKPIIFLHGNTASSRIFAGIVNLYVNFKVILMDFSGYGQSERLEVFPADLWYEEAKQVINFIEYKKYKQVDLIGSSGGALAALNVALERPDLVNKLIADSFLYDSHLRLFTEKIIPARELSKKSEGARAFFHFCHGNDWENVVDNDTKAIFEYFKQQKKCFHKSLETLKPKVLITGSRGDELVNPEIYTDLLEKIPDGQKYLFEKGGHPAIISNSEEFARIALKFFNKD